MTVVKTHKDGMVYVPGPAIVYLKNRSKRINIDRGNCVYISSDQIEALIVEEGVRANEVLGIFK